MAIVCTPQSPLTGGAAALAAGYPYISSANTVTIPLFNTYSYSVTPNTVTWSCKVTM